MVVFTLPETYAPLILKRKAQRKRDETGDDRYFAPIEARKRTMVQLTESILARPFKMLFYEPMLLAITIYMSVSSRADQFMFAELTYTTLV